MWKYLIIICSLLPFMASASVGIPSGVLWCSKAQIVAGDAVTCTTVVANPEAIEARGTVEFLINGKLFDSKQVFVPGGSYKNVDFSFTASEGKEEYLARVTQGQFYDKEGTPIPVTDKTKTPLITSAFKVAVTAKPPEPPAAITSVATDTASTSRKTVIVSASSSSPIDPSDIEKKLHDALPDRVATPIASVSVPVVKTLEEFRTGQDASNQARIGALVKELGPAPVAASSSKEAKGTTTLAGASSAAPLSPWGLIKEHLATGAAFRSSPLGHLMLLFSLVWDLVVHNWWLFYVICAWILYDVIAFAKRKWQERNY